MLENIIKKLKYTYVVVEEGSYEKILNLFDKNILYEPLTSNEFLYLGLYYKNRHEYNVSYDYFVKAYKLDNSKATYELGVFYDNIKKDYIKAKKYYIKASQLGNVKAMNNLAILYKDIEKDYIKAKEYYIKASELGSNNAMNNLGIFYKNIEKDYDKAKECFIKAIELGNIYAINSLGVFYEIIEKNYVKAKEYYIKASELGNVRAMNNLGIFYEIIEKDYDKAKEYYIKATELVNVQAMHNLADLYLNIEKDYDKAMEYYKLTYSYGKHDSFDDIIMLYKKVGKIEEAIIFGHDCKKKDKVFELLNELSYPVKDQYKEEIYKIVETFEFDGPVSMNITKILQNAISVKYKTICQIAYHYKKYTLN